MYPKSYQKHDRGYTEDQLSKCAWLGFPYLRRLPRHRPRVSSAVVVAVPVAADAPAAAAEPGQARDPPVVPVAVGAGGAGMEEVHIRLISFTNNNSYVCFSFKRVETFGFLNEV